MEYLLAIDVGTTSLKTTLFDRQGQTIASCVREYAVSTPHADWVEVYPETYWTSARDAIRELLRDSAVQASAIVGVGVTSQGESLIVLDAAGQPMRPAIVWLDNRSQAEADELGKAFDAEEVYRRTGQPEMVPAWTATRIMWLKHHEPQIYRGAARYLLVADYLLYRLTGRFVTDRGLNPSTVYYDLTTDDWWEAMLDALGISRSQLPELVSSGERAGTVRQEASDETGLQAGTPVTTAPIDQIAAAVGAGNMTPGVVTECTGAAMALCATVDRPVYDPMQRVGLYVHAVAGKYVLLPWVPTAGMALRWLRDTCGGGCSYASLADEARDVSAGAGGLFMLPHLAGSGTPAPNAHARGVFWGLTLAHRRGHLARAVMESVAFMLRGNLQLLQDIGAPVQAVRCLGGGARSDLWLQIKADVCRRDLMVMDAEEATGLGTAMIAAVGAGLYADLAEASGRMVRMRKHIPFNVDRADAYEPVYRRYVELDRQAQTMFG